METVERVNEELRMTDLGTLYLSKAQLERTVCDLSAEIEHLSIKNKMLIEDMSNQAFFNKYQDVLEELNQLKADHEALIDYRFNDKRTTTVKFQQDIENDQDNKRIRSKTHAISTNLHRDSSIDSTHNETKDVSKILGYSSLHSGRVVRESQLDSDVSNHVTPQKFSKSKPRLPISSIGQKSMNLTGKQLRANNPNYYEDSRSIFKGGRLREKSEGSNADLRNTDERTKEDKSASSKLQTTIGLTLEIPSKKIEKVKRTKKKQESVKKHHNVSILPKNIVNYVESIK